MPPSPSSPSHLHLPHLSSSSFVISISFTPHASCLTPPSLSLTQSLHHSLSHTPASISRHLPPTSTLWPLHAGLHIYSIYPTTHTYSLSRLTASTPNESASAATSTCRPPHAVLLTRVDLFILTVTFSLFNFLITLSLFCILGFV